MREGEGEEEGEALAFQPDKSEVSEDRRPGKEHQLLPFSY